MFICQAGEKVKQERDECHWHSTASKKIPAQNPHLRAIQEELLQDSQELDTYLLFLYGIICKGLKLQSNARDAFVQSVALNPWNLGAWQELTSIVSSAEEVRSLVIEVHATSTNRKSQMNRILCEMPEKHMMMNVFQILASVESDLYPLEQILPLFDSIESVFLNNSWMKTQKALIYYNNRGIQVLASTDRVTKTHP